MKPRTLEQKRVQSLISKSRPIGKRAIRRIEEGDITKDKVKVCYFCQWERVEEYQVFRYFEVMRNLKTKKIKYIDEKFRNYLNCENFKQTIVAKCFNGMATCNSRMPVFYHSSELEVRTPHTSCGGWYQIYDYQDCECYDTYVKSVHPLMVQRKVTPRVIEEWGSYSFLKDLFGENGAMIETSLCWGDKNLLNYLLSGNQHRVDNNVFWRSMLIARRHGFDFTYIKYTDFSDYLYQLQDLGLDLHSPKYLCPTDFHNEHARLCDIAYRRREAENIRREEERERKSLTTELGKDETFKKEHGKYFSILIKTDGLNIRPLTSILEFFEEGKAMHHCVYSCHYYDNANSLILSARDNEGNRVETIEYDLKGLKVLQSRGVCNKFTPFHDEIVSVVERQMPMLLKQIKRQDAKVAC